MDPIDRNFAALSLQMSRLAVPERATTAPPPSLASLIDRVNAAKRHYEPGLRR
ncbi:MULTISPECIES: hypothetical protein [Sphingobium]|jgi:hypothetical protein|uniref:Uncharacterized protein n=1 Tax=Sphingobium tyrosinilyticum TaxID=2715436 RepID=A0ABV9F273_9SPHN|nr:hypothetical protein [Sphingobium sp. EP60837]ANI77997.1 hypothetical protein EP837_01581 [Sphingobium sp. EP60837]